MTLAGPTGRRYPTGATVPASREVRRGPLGDAQLFEWWKCFHHSGGATVPLTVPVPQPVTRADARAAIEAVVARHEALRTTFDLDERGAPYQVVHPFDPGAVPVTELPHRQRREVLLEQVWRAGFQLDRDPPVRAYLYVDDGADTGDGRAVTGIVLIFAHLVMDAVGTGAVLRDIIEVLDARCAGRPVRLAPVARQPLDLVALDAAPASGPSRQRAEDHWTRRLAAMPSRVFPGGRADRFDLYAGTVVSATAPAVFAAAARRYGTSPAVVYTAVIHVLLAVLSGQGGVVVRTHYHGRRLEADGVAGCFHRILPTATDLSDRPPLSEVVARVAAETLAAQRRYQIGAIRLKELEAWEAMRRGTVFAAGTTVNFDLDPAYRRLLRRDAGAPPEDPGTDPTVLLNRADPPVRTTDAPGMDAYFTVRIAPGSMKVQAGFNGETLRRPEMEILLREPERILHRAAREGDVGFAQIAAALDTWQVPARAPRPVVRHSPVSLAQTAEVITGHPDVRAAHVSVERGADSPRLVAFAAVAGAPVRPRDLRRFVLGRLRADTAVVCPDHFVLVDSAPDRRDDTDAWRGLPPVAQGPGTEVEVCVPRTGAEAALHAAVAAVNRVEIGSMDLTYLAAGGSLLLVPAVLVRLAGNGFRGLEPDDFARPVPLTALAAALRRVG